MNQFNPVTNMQQQRLMQMEQQYGQQFNPQFNNQFCQPFSNQFQQQYMNGRIVDDVNTVAANEVPMDGSISVFPRRDLKEVYLKNWGNDGMIRTNRYVLQNEDIVSNQNEESNSIQNDIKAILDKIDSMETMIDSLSNKQQNVNTRNNRKENEK